VSQRSLRSAGGLRLAVPMTARDPTEPDRAATPLELFFDLVFIVAVASAVEGLHDGLVRGDVARSALGFFAAFFALWWAWMNFTWFASAYDSNDVLYRVSMLVAMVGALILAAGIPEAFALRDRWIAVLGYVVMRLVLVSQWLRVARDDPPRRSTALRFAIGVTACQIGWVTALALSPGWWIAVAPFGAVLELLVPVWAESTAPTPWHPGHIAERYGLFTIIVLGESVLAASLAIQSVMRDGLFTGELLGIIAGGLLILFSMWWLYFDRPAERLDTSTGTAFIWGYGHLPVFASAAALGAGLAAAVDSAAGRSELGSTATGAAVAVPVAIFLLGMWLVHARSREAPVRKVAPLVVVLLVLAAPFSSWPLPLVGLLLSGLVVVKVRARLLPQDDSSPPTRPA
jgi:low temperature requirement protein LtrA